jgi:hypothetical protein
VLLGAIDGSVDGIDDVLAGTLGSKLGVKYGYELSFGKNEMVGTALGMKPDSDDG